MILTNKEAKRVRTLGRFCLFYIFFWYTSFFIGWYGREGVMEDYHYNLVFVQEIKRFILYRNQLGTFAVFSNLFGNILIFMPYGYFLTMAGKRKSFFRTLFYSMGLSLGVEVMQLLTKLEF